MAKQFFHFLLILTFSVFTLTNTHAMPAGPANNQVIPATMSTEHNHHTMVDCDQSADTESKTCCEDSCSCLMNHCHKTQTLLPSSLVSSQTQAIEPTTQASNALVHRTITPQKRPPKA